MAESLFEREAVLFVEADVERMTELEAGLAGSPFVARFAESGEAALWGLRDAPPSTLVVNLDAPVLDGWFVLADVGAWDRRPTIVAISRDEGVRLRARALGADHFVVAPVNLADCVAHVLDLAAALSAG